MYHTGLSIHKHTTFTKCTDALGKIYIFNGHGGGVVSLIQSTQSDAIFPRKMYTESIECIYPQTETNYEKNNDHY